MTQTLASTDPATQGSWEKLKFNSEVLAVHAALLHTGKVLFAAGSGNNERRFDSPDFGNTDMKNWTSVVWDPSVTPSGGDSNFSHPNTLRGRHNDPTDKPIDFFCGGESFLADGTLLSAGGTLRYDIDPNDHPLTDGFFGRRATVTFDPHTQQWTQQLRGDLHVGRWYPALVTLGDGRVLAGAGKDDTGKIDSDAVKAVEVFSPQTGTWENLGVPHGPGFNRLPLYAHLILLQDGRVFFSGGRMDDSVNQGPAILDHLTPGAVTATTIGGLEHPELRNQSASVLLPPAQDQRVMIIGGGPDSGKDPTSALKLVAVVDLKAPQPAFHPAPPMKNFRVHLNAVLLPDRTVFVSGGADRHEDNDQGISEQASHAIRQGEIYDPATDTWRVVASATVSRMYHSVALLLPDGRVVTAGNNPQKGKHVKWNEDPDSEEMALEIYSPPYLFRGTRPAIGTAPQEWRHGQAVQVQSPQAASIKWASLIKSGVTTHSFDTGQRLVDLPIDTRGSDSLSLRVPGNPNIAPPGWYMLFLTDQTGVPSEAKWIHLPPV
jgi:hypothetical protein